MVELAMTGSDCSPQLSPKLALGRRFDRAQFLDSIA
jgi:hypothetical protein